jgi:colanic acid biosynthesis glycosyl transferase WcaI
MGFHAGALLATRRLGWPCDVVLSQSPPLSIGLVGSWIADYLNAKSIYIVQDVFPDGLIRQGKIANPVVIALLRGLERWVYRRSDALCTISDGFAEAVRPRAPRGKPIEVIPNFVNTDLYKPLPRVNDYARDHGLASGFVVSYVGNIGNAQDLGPVLAAARACADLPIKFVMVGDGISREHFEDRARAEGLDSIEFWGYQPRETTPWINASSDLTLVLLASHVGSFGFPSKIFTLMASGRPIVLVGDPDSDIADLVRRTGTGWVVPCGDHGGFAALIRELYEQRHTLPAHGQRGTQVVADEFSVQAVARRYDDLIRRLTGKQAEDGHGA